MKIIPWLGVIVMEVLANFGLNISFAEDTDSKPSSDGKVRGSGGGAHKYVLSAAVCLSNTTYSCSISLAIPGYDKRKANPVSRPDGSDDVPL